MAVTRRSPEKQIEADIIKALRTLGFLVSKTSQPRASMMTPGIPDLYAAHPRWRLRLWIEVKAPKGRTSPQQDLWHAIERDSGGTVIIARSTSDLVTELQKLGAPLAA